MDFVVWFLFIIVAHGSRFFFSMYNCIQSCLWPVSGRWINCGQCHNHLQARHLPVLWWQIEIIYKSGRCIFCSQGLAKPDNPFNRKRKNLLATSKMFNRNEELPHRRSTSNIGKRLADFPSSRRVRRALLARSASCLGFHLCIPRQQRSPACRSISSVDLHDSACIISEKD